MIRRLSVIVPMVLLGLPYSVTAQEEPADNALREGSWALLFQVGNDLTLRPFQGGAVAGKYHITADRAIRLTIGLTGNFGSGTSLSAPIAPDSSFPIRSTDGSSTSTSIQTSIQYLWYISSTEPLHLFVGVGPQGQYRRDHGESRDVYNEYAYWTMVDGTQTTKSWGAGAAGALGLEWFFARSFSLEAEYGMSLTYYWTSTQQESRITTNSQFTYPSGSANSGSTRGWSITSDTFRFGLSVYF